jgi:hypothetical protein
VKTTLDYIATMWLEGVTTREIGERLHIPKNSVCRMVFDARKGGDMRFPARGFAIPKKPKPKPKPLTVGPPMPRRKRPLYPIPPPPPPRAVPPFIYELKPHECRFAVSGLFVARDAHRFCAKPQVEGSPYCEEHRALCVGTMKPRVRA